jgi:tetratricopeptide (TPR) repeat protein
MHDQAAPPAGASATIDVTWPIRCGAVPPLADKFYVRLETVPDIGAALERNPVAVLTAKHRTEAPLPNWHAACGKTQQAVYFAETQWRSGSAELLMWFDAASRDSLLAGYLEAVRLTSGAEPVGDAEAVAVSFLSWLRQLDRPWLAVLDDLSSPEVIDGLWPDGAAGRVLITATDSRALGGQRRAMVCQIGPFSRQEAMSYLVGRLSGDPDQRRGAIDLIDDLEWEPLALAQASSVIANSWLTSFDYRGHYVRRHEQLANSAAARVPPAGVTWTLGVDLADQLLPGGGAQACLIFAATLDGNGIPADVFTTPAGCGHITGDGSGSNVASTAVRNALVCLERAGLLQLDRGSDPPIVLMNQAVQSAVRVATPAASMDAVWPAAATALLQAWPQGKERTLLAQRLRSSAASLARAAGPRPWSGGCHPLLQRLGESLDGAQMTTLAVRYWRDLSAHSDQVLGPSNRDSFAIVERLASACLAAGRADEAIGWHQRIVGDAARAVGPDHPRTFAARISLGKALVAAGQFADAITVLTGAIDESEQAHGPGHPDVVAAREELADAYLAAGEAAQAIDLYRRALQERERSQGPRHPETLRARERLAAACLADEQVKEALSNYKRALADRERTQGRDHRHTLEVRIALASAYHKAGRMAQALQQFEQARTDCLRVLGPDDPDSVTAAAKLAKTYYTVGRLTDAATLLRDTAERCSRILPPGDPLTRSVLETLATITGEPGGPGQPE